MGEENKDNKAGSQEEVINLAPVAELEGMSEEQLIAKFNEVNAPEKQEVKPEVKQEVKEEVKTETVTTPPEAKEEKKEDLDFQGLLAGKFKSPEQLERGYKELESHTGKQANELGELRKKVVELQEKISKMPEGQEKEDLLAEAEEINPTAMEIIDKVVDKKMKAKLQVVEEFEKKVKEQEELNKKKSEETWNSNNLNSFNKLKQGDDSFLVPAVIGVIQASNPEELKKYPDVVSEAKWLVQRAVLDTNHPLHDKIVQAFPDIKDKVLTRLAAKQKVASDKEVKKVFPSGQGNSTGSSMRTSFSTDELEKMTPEELQKLHSQIKK